MADLDILPTWALNYLQENLTDHTHVVNALPIDKGRMKGSFILNTSRGAVVVSKRRGGEPQHWFLPLPVRHFTFTCHVCQERMEFVDPNVPRTVYCSHCGTRHTLLMEHGDMVLRRDSEVARDPKRSVEPVREVPPPAPAPRPTGTGPFTHGDYTLYERQTQTKGGGETTFYFFAKHAPKSGRPTQKPDGYSVGVNDRTGLPFLRRDDKAREAPKAQCGAFTEDGKQCRLTAAPGRKYCHVHKGYRPISREEVFVRLDGKPRSRAALDTLPGEGDRGRHENQCAALTTAGEQCSNRSREGSKYCGTHKGYRPARGMKSTDTKPVGRKVKDTAPTVRRG